jgi:integral membrane sensor domain MASE1
MDPARVRQLEAHRTRSEDLGDPVEALADRLVRVGVGLALAAVLTQTIVHLVNAFTLDRAMLTVNGEQNLSAWATSATIFAAGLACLLLAIVGQRPTLPLLGVAGLLAFFSLDEALAVHERVANTALERLDLSSAWDSVVWPIIYLPLTGAILVTLLVVSRTSPRTIGRLLVVGLGCLVLAVAAEVVSAPISDDENLAHTLEGALEEGLEFAGWALIATALLGLYSVKCGRFDRERDVQSIVK